jgi:hypothetical protein
LQLYGAILRGLLGLYLTDIHGYWSSLLSQGLFLRSFVDGQWLILQDVVIVSFLSNTILLLLTPKGKKKPAWRS